VERTDRRFLRAFLYVREPSTVTTFVLDASAVLELARGDTAISSEHELEAPALIRSQVLSELHEAVQRGELTADEAHRRRGWFRSLPIRLFGDAVLMRRAWELAERLGWSGTYDAEYVAVAQLHRATLITANAKLARSVEGIVPTASPDVLR
jgi:predicted nucleic acid-binding protein